MSTWIAGKGTIPAVTTNADRIRAMDDWELSVFLMNVSSSYCDSERWREWLKQEATADAK